MWNPEDAFRSWWTDVMEPALAGVDLAAGEHEIKTGVVLGTSIIAGDQLSRFTR